MLEQLRDGRYQKCVGASSKIDPAPLTTAQTVCQKTLGVWGLTASKNLPKNLQIVLEFEVCNLIMTLTCEPIGSSVFPSYVTFYFTLIMLFLSHTHTRHPMTDESKSTRFERDEIGIDFLS